MTEKVTENAPDIDIMAKYHLNTITQRETRDGLLVRQSFQGIQKLAMFHFSSKFPHDFLCIDVFFYFQDHGSRFLPWTESHKRYGGTGEEYSDQ